jgi:hypothetical protein
MQGAIQFKTLGRLAALLISFVIVIGGCGKKDPDAVQLRSDLEKRLEENNGKTSIGNAPTVLPKVRIISEWTTKVRWSVSEDSTCLQTAGIHFQNRHGKLSDM